MHKKIKTNSCFPKKIKKKKNGNLHCGKKIEDLQIIRSTLNGFGFSVPNQLQKFSWSKQMYYKDGINSNHK